MTGSEKTNNEIFCFILTLEVETTQDTGRKKTSPKRPTCDEITIYVFILLLQPGPEVKKDTKGLH